MSLQSGTLRIDDLLYFQSDPVTVQFLRADLAQRLAGELEAVDKVDGTMLRC